MLGNPAASCCSCLAPEGKFGKSSAPSEPPNPSPAPRTGRDRWKQRSFHWEHWELPQLRAGAIPQSCPVQRCRVRPFQAPTSLPNPFFRLKFCPWVDPRVVQCSLGAAMPRSQQIRSRGRKGVPGTGAASGAGAEQQGPFLLGTGCGDQLLRVLLGRGCQELSQCLGHSPGPAVCLELGLGFQAE